MCRNKIGLFKSYQRDCIEQFEHGHFVCQKMGINHISNVILCTNLEGISKAEGSALDASTRSYSSTFSATSTSAVETDPSGASGYCAQFLSSISLIPWVTSPVDIEDAQEKKVCQGTFQ